LTDDNLASFLNDKSRIINEVLQGIRSINDNGFSNGVKHLKESLKLLDQFKKDHDYFDKLLEQKQKEDKHK